jgi:hypothetical protein
MNFPAASKGFANKGLIGGEEEKRNAHFQL